MTQAESNAQNALQSTGPRTPEGKASAAQNTFKHGAYSEAILILGEDPAAFNRLRDGLVESLNPIGFLEESIVDRLATLWWRMDRVRRAEREALKVGTEYAQQDQRRILPEPTHTAFLTWANRGDAYMERLGRFETQLEKSFFRLVHELERIQVRRQGQDIPLPVIMDISITGG
jgi:hypothetical protein